MRLFHRDIFTHQLRAMLYFYLWIPCLVIGISLMLDWYVVRLPLLPATWFIRVGALFMVGAGVGLIWLSTSDLARFGNGTPSPRKPAVVVVQQGSYGWCRHPMHLGYLIILLGILLAMRSLAGILIPWLVLVVWTVHVLRKEEKVLCRRFGNHYRAYQHQVPFLLPIRFRRSTPSL